MKKMKGGVLVVTALAFLAGCTVTTTHINQIDQTKLANGKAVAVGFRAAEIPWQCQKITFTRLNWENADMESMVSIRGTYGILEDKAMAYANAQHLTPDYIGILMPTEATVGGWDVGKSTATVIYYRCKHLTIDN